MPWADILIIILEFLSNRLKDDYAIFDVRAPFLSNAIKVMARCDVTYAVYY